MEPAQAKIEGRRIILSLGKYRVTERTNTHMKIALGGSTIMTVPVTPLMDVREGDLLTLYTEVLYAKPSSAPIQ